MPGTALFSPAIPVRCERRAESWLVPGLGQGRKPSLEPIPAAGPAQEGQQHRVWGAWLAGWSTARGRTGTHRRRCRW